MYIFFFSSRRRHTRLQGDWSSDVCSSDLVGRDAYPRRRAAGAVVDKDIVLTVRIAWDEIRRDGSERDAPAVRAHRDRKSTRLNSSHLVISYAVFCLKKKSHGHRTWMPEPL